MARSAFFAGSYQFGALKKHGIKLSSRSVIPAEAGIQILFFILDSRFHGNDGVGQTPKESFSKS